MQFLWWFLWVELPLKNPWSIGVGLELSVERSAPSVAIPTKWNPDSRNFTKGICIILSGLIVVCWTLELVNWALSPLPSAPYYILKTANPDRGIHVATVQFPCCRDFASRWPWATNMTHHWCLVDGCVRRYQRGVFRLPFVLYQSLMFRLLNKTDESDFCRAWNQPRFRGGISVAP